MANPFEFIQETRAEIAKVTWPSRRETITAAVMVLVMTLVTALFFMLTDQVFSWAIQYLVGAPGR